MSTTDPQNTADSGPKYQSGDSVGLFIPCYIDRFYASAGEATVRLLRKYGVTPDFPDGQTCCGQPAFNSGYWDEARKIVRHFCDVFKDYRWIVCPSGSCAAMCRSFFGHLDPSPAVVDVGQRVYDLCEFLVDVLDVTSIDTTLPGKQPAKVALHIGCHTRRELGAAEQAETLLRSVGNIDICEIPDVTECCGFGGTFSVKVPEVSLDMGRAKAENIIQSGCDILATTDSSCLMHFAGILNKLPGGDRIKTCHIAQLLDEKSAAKLINSQKTG